MGEVEQSMLNALRVSFQEDCPSGDLTVQLLNKSLDKPSDTVPFVIKAKAEGVVVGLWAWTMVSQHVDPETCDVRFSKDGTHVTPGMNVVEGHAPWAWLMRWERSVLNISGFLSGIATQTLMMKKQMQLVNSVVDLVDTRKTLPGFRVLSKHAVVCGGGKNHRKNLSDSILLKENHLEKIGGVVEALKRLSVGKIDYDAEIELANKKDLTAFIEFVQKNGLPSCLKWIMLDNFKPSEVKEALELIAPVKQLKKLKIELSGGINAKTIKDYARLPVHRISVGALTHSVTVLDLSLLVGRA